MRISWVMAPQRVYHGCAHAVEAAGDLIAAAAEFAAGMEHGIHNLQRGPPGLGLDIHGDAAAVIGDGDGVAGVDGNGDMLTVSRQCFIDGVIHDLVYKVMQTARARRADVHTRAHTHRFQTFKDLDLTGVIGIGIDWCIFRHGCSSMSLIKGYILRALQKRRGVELR